MEELNYDNIEYLRNFIPFKAFFDELLPQYDEIFDSIGEILKKEIVAFCIKITEDMEELIDFLDGNGFEIKWANRSSFYIRNYYIDVRPLYPPKPEPEPTCELVWTTTTYYTPIEDIEPTSIERNLVHDWFEDEYLTFSLNQQIINLYKETHKKTRENGRSPPKG